MTWTPITLKLGGDYQGRELERREALLHNLCLRRAIDPRHTAVASGLREGHEH